MIELRKNFMSALADGQLMLEFRHDYDPVKLVKVLWPHIVLYKQQRQMFYSVWYDADDTTVVAGNMLGKDFTAGLIALTFFITRHPCRIVTTSCDAHQLNIVLWGEIRRFIQDCKYPLLDTDGGPLVFNHLFIRKMHNGQRCGLSYIVGRVAAKGEGMLGHHIEKNGDGVPRTLFIADEASGVDDESNRRSSTWRDRGLWIGNAYQCMTEFKRNVQMGDKRDTRNPKRFYHKLIRIRAKDSPNVQLALAQVRAGKRPTGEFLIKGVLGYDDYVKRRETWDPVRQLIGLDAEFDEGAGSRLYTTEMLDRAERYAVFGNRRASGIGIDSAEGGDATCICVVDEHGILELTSYQTRDTSVIPGLCLDAMRKWNVPAEKVAFDIGGGGKEHADRLRNLGYAVRAIAFGGSVTLELRRGLTPMEQRRTNRDDKAAYKNRRAEMYGDLRDLLSAGAFSIPSGEMCAELRRQLSLMPLLYDDDGKMRMLPKRKTKRNTGSDEPSLTELLGRSPDDADALVLAIHAMTSRGATTTAGML